jgi:TRAP-type C4-dicarboxylate transport system permease small subunit
MPPGQSNSGVSRAIQTVRTITDRTVIAIFFFMVVAVLAGIIGRHLNLKVADALEAATFAQIWLTTIGASVAMRHGSMFALDTLTRHLGLGPARILSVLIAVLSIILVIVLVYGGILLTEASLRQMSPVMRIPMWTIFISLPIGMSLLGAEIVLHVIEHWDRPFRDGEEELT